jgi:hypothetical protein
MRRIARSGCEPGTRPSRSTYENSNPDLSSIPRIIPIRLASTRGNHANETKERTFFNILLMPWRSGGTLDELYDKRPRALCRFKRMAGLATQTFDQSNPSSFNERCTAGRAFIRSK